MNREKKLHRVWHAFYDGVVIGMDPIGTVLGHITKKPYYVGYLAHAYSLTYFDIECNYLFGSGGPINKLLEPTKRTIDEKGVELVGGLVGLTTNLLFGCPQWYFLDEAYRNKESVEIAGRAKRAIDRGDIQIPGKKSTQIYNPFRN